MSVWLFIDDARDCPPGWTLARNVAAALKIIKGLTEPLAGISFDHDLEDFDIGTEQTGYTLACLIEERHADGQNILGPNTFVNVHSQNPVGAARIRSALLNIAKRDEAGFSISRIFAPDLPAGGN